MLIGVKIEKEEYLIENIQNLISITDNDEVTSMSWGDDDEREILIGCGVKDIRRLYVYVYVINNLLTIYN